LRGCKTPRTKQAADVRQHVVVTFQEMVLDDELTGHHLLDYHGCLYRMGKAERKARIYFGSMKRRRHVAWPMPHSKMLSNRRWQDGLH